MNFDDITEVLTEDVIVVRRFAAVFAHIVKVLFRNSTLVILMAAVFR